MLRHARGYALATSLLECNDTRALQAYLDHRNIQGNNALEVVIQRLGEMAEQMRHDRICTGAPRSPNPV
jgi:hypothetical protein